MLKMFKIALFLLIGWMSIRHTDQYIPEFNDLFFLWFGMAYWWWIGKVDRGEV